MNMQKSFLKQTLSPASYDLIVITTVSILIYVAADIFNVYELLQAWLSIQFKLDELVLVLIVLAFGFAIFSFRRWHELSVLLLKVDNVEAELDMTDTRLAETETILAHRELELQNARVVLLEEIISDLSHDIKTPLSSIQTFLYLFNKSTDSEKQRYYLNELDTQIKGLSRLVEDILSLTRLEKSETLQLAPQDVNQLLKTVVQPYTHIMSEKSISFTLSLHETNPKILGHSSELSRAFGNLIENAVTYTPEKGSVRISSYPLPNNQVVVEITDTGMGIDPSEQKAVFERFYRSEKARSSRTEGTGLGLSIVKRTIEQHKGRIELDSSPGRGSTFKVYLHAGHS